MDKERDYFGKVQGFSCAPGLQRGKYLRQCLDSVVNQTLKELEIIIVNDGSKDSSLAIMQEYAAKDDRIVIIDKPNSGYGNSMTRGFDRATGEYFGIIESDDYAELDMFERLYNTAKEHELDVVKSGFLYYWSTPKRSMCPILSLLGSPVAAPSVPWKT